MRPTRATLTAQRHNKMNNEDEISQEINTNCDHGNTSDAKAEEAQHTSFIRGHGVT